MFPKKKSSQKKKKKKKEKIFLCHIKSKDGKFPRVGHLVQNVLISISKGVYRFLP